ncbi:MAG: hypothetical protein ACREHD_21410, partial [Pirellulales bacterium]
TMAAHDKRRVRQRLTPNASLPNSLVYTPIEDWSNDDVWLFLMQYKNPWGHTNKSLLGMYQGASDGGECPLVVDTSTPSCGTSRFGCWPGSTRGTASTWSSAIFPTPATR